MLSGFRVHRERRQEAGRVRRTVVRREQGADRRTRPARVRPRVAGAGDALRARRGPVAGQVGAREERQIDAGLARAEVADPAGVALDHVDHADAEAAVRDRQRRSEEAIGVERAGAGDGGVAAAVVRAGAPLFVDEMQCLPGPAPLVQSNFQVPVLAVRVEVPVWAWAERSNTFEAPSTTAPGGTLTAFPPPRSRQARPRSESFVVQAVSEKIAPPKGADGPGIRPAPPQLIVPGTFVVVSWWNIAAAAHGKSGRGDRGRRRGGRRGGRRASMLVVVVVVVVVHTILLRRQLAMSFVLHAGLVLFLPFFKYLGALRGNDVASLVFHVALGSSVLSWPGRRIRHRRGPSEAQRASRKRAAEAPPSPAP